MNPQLHHEVTRRLLNDFNFKQKDSCFWQGVGPNCQKKELYTNADEPWVLHCGRLNILGKKSVSPALNFVCGLKFPFKNKKKLL